MQRRGFIAGLGSTAAWPLAARAQQRGMPVVGFLMAGTPDSSVAVPSLRLGLSQVGYTEGRDVVLEFLWAEYRYDRLPEMASELVRRHVSVIVSPSTPATLAAKAATKSIPIVFQIGIDPVEIGFVGSYRRPTENLTGIYNLITGVTAKRLEFFHELMPTARSIAALVNPANTALAKSELRELQMAADALGVHLLVAEATAPSQFEAVFDRINTMGADGLILGGDSVFLNNGTPVVGLAARTKVPTIFASSLDVAAGGLMSYGTDFVDAWRLVGGYAGRILKGDSPTDLPVQQVTKIRLAVNLKTARALGLKVPQSILVRADEVIE
jgi:putative ABC transport system substrate-binding protein